jgi:large subunit ribosomal protein L31
VKQGIHPNYQAATVVCACGNTWETRSTRSNLRVDLCNKCHPFYTGEQRIVDTAGQVERFMRRLEGAQAAPRRKKAERRQAKIDQRTRIQGRDEQLLVAGIDDEEAES